MSTVELSTTTASKSPVEAGRFLRVEDLTLRYKSASQLVTAIRQASFTVHESERCVLLGPSGCGKTTILKAVGGYVHAASGSITLRGEEIKKPGPDRVMVFQEFDQLLPWKTVKENIVFPLIVARKMTRNSAAEKAMGFLEKVSLSKFSNSYPHTLSGGMKQRVALARAMALEPDILLMDEPFASLDALTRRNMQEELLDLWNDIRFTMLFVTHSIEEAIIIGDRIVLLSSRPGQVRSEFTNRLNGCLNEEKKEFKELKNTIHNELFSSEIVAEGSHI